MLNKIKGTRGKIFGYDQENTRIFIYFFIIAAILVSFIFPTILLHKTYDQTETEKKIYFAANNSPAIKEIIKSFNERNKGKIRVELVVFEYEKFSTNKKKDLITRTMRSQNGKIDIFSIDQIWVPRISKWSEDLLKYFSEEELSNLVSPALETCIFNNSLSSIPLFLDLGILYYRKDLIFGFDDYEEITRKLNSGITWNELLKISSRFRPKETYVFQGKNYEGLICNLFEFVGKIGEQEDSNLFNNLSNPEIVSRINFMRDLIWKNKITPSEVLNFDEVGSFKYAIHNDIPFFRGWSTIYKLVNISSEDSTKIKNLEIAPPPTLDSNKSTSTIGGWNLMISKYSNVKKEAVKFIKYCISEEAQKILYTRGEYLPVLKKIYEDKSFVKQHPRLKFYSNRLKHIIRRPFIENYTLLSDMLAGYIHKVLANQLSTREALRLAQVNIKKIINN